MSSSTDSAPTTTPPAAAPAKKPDPVTPPTNVILYFSYAVIVGLWAASPIVFIPYVANLITLVTAILYAACHASLSILVKEEDDDQSTKDTGTTNKSAQVETMTKEDAYQFPLVGSISLFSLYAAVRYLDPSWVNFIIGGYFAMIGCVALAVTLSPAMASLLPKSLRTKLEERFIWKKEIHHPLQPEIIFGPSPWEIDVDFKYIEALACLPSVVFCYFYLLTKHWTMNNVLGICFCLQGIQRFSLGTYKTGAILLIGLFFYDIFWVFGTEVMVTVAKNLDGPIKILFPRSLDLNEETGKLDLSLLGLGDIVIPGFFLALLLRFDAQNADIFAKYKDESVVHAAFPKPYFHAGLFSYVIGIGLTMFVMIYFEAAQPALLYLVPACLISSMGCALIKGETMKLLEYSEESEEPEEEEEVKDETAKKED